jgi:hypothetical protein
MSRKHYREVADILSRSKQKDHWSFDDVINELCIMFKNDNPRFNASKFKEACESK